MPRSVNFPPDPVLLSNTIADPFWTAQTQLYYGAGASSENDGLSAGSPITFPEIARRMAGGLFDASVSIKLTTNVASNEDVDLSWFKTSGVGSVANLLINADLPTPLYTGSITALQTQDKTSTTAAAWEITDSALSGTWSNSGTGGVSLVNRLLVAHNGGGAIVGAGYVTKDIEATRTKSARIQSPTTADPATISTNSTATSIGTFTVGNTFSIYDYTLWQSTSLRPPPANVYFQNVRFTSLMNMRATTGTFRPIFCTFDGGMTAGATNAAARQCNFVGAATWGGTGTALGDYDCVFKNTLQVNTPSFEGGGIRTLQGGSIVVNHRGGYIAGGATGDRDIAAFDCSGTILFVNGSSVAEIAGKVWGQGNSSFILETSGGSWIRYTTAPATGITSQANPFWCPNSGATQTFNTLPQVFPNDNTGIIAQV